MIAFANGAGGNQSYRIAIKHLGTMVRVKHIDDIVLRESVLFIIHTDSLLYDLFYHNGDMTYAKA